MRAALTPIFHKDRTRNGAQGSRSPNSKDDDHKPKTTRRLPCWAYLRTSAVVLLIVGLVLLDGSVLPAASLSESLLCPTSQSVTLGSTLAISRSPIPRPLPVYRSEGEPASAAPGRYTVMLNTFRRHDQLQRSIRTYEHCGNIDAIRVIWSEQTPAPTPALNASFFSPHKSVRFDAMPSTSFNNRFRPIPGLKTEAVLALDDDIYMPCADLDRAFHAWEQNPRQLAGFYPRAHLARARPEGGCSYIYSTKLSTVWLARAYSIVLTKAAVLHRDYLEMYTHYMPAGIREEVDKRRNCEDIAMQFLVSHVTDGAPTAVGSLWIRDVGQGNAALGQVAGVSAMGGHMAARSECLTAFARYYGGLPLVSRALAATEGSWRIRLSSLIFWR